MTGPVTVQQQQPPLGGMAPPPYTLQPVYGYQQQPGQPPKYTQQYNPYAAESQGISNPYAQHQSYVNHAYVPPGNV